MPTTDTATAGGAMSGTQITNASTGEWSPQLIALSSGVIDNAPDLVQQYQLAYICNTGTASWFNGGFFVDNCLIYPGTPGVATLQSTSASDDATKFVRVVGVISISGVLTLSIDDITLNGTTPVSGLKTYVRVERLELRYTSSGLLAVAAGRISLLIGSIATGAIPAPIPITGGGFTSYSYATAENQYCGAAVLGDLGTFTNRKTDPFGGMGTWLRPNTIATMLPVASGGTLTTTTGTDRFGIYRLTTLQPGVPSCNPIVAANKLYGNS